MSILIVSIVVLFSVLFIVGALGTAAIIGRIKYLDKYSQVVPGYSIRMTGSPFSLEEIANCLDILSEEWFKVKSTDKIKIKKKLNVLSVEWLEGTREDSGEVKRYITDSYGRKIAGDNTNDHIRVVYLSNDHLKNTAFIHECCHTLHTLDGIVDYNHEEEAVWGSMGIVATVKSRLQ